jgi:hypothetical protein
MSDGPAAFLYVFQDGGIVVGRKNAQIDTGCAQVRADANLADGDQQSVCGTGLAQKNLTEFFLHQPVDFILSGCVHEKVIFCE